MASESSKVWSAMSLGSSVGAAVMTRKALWAGWRAAAGKEPPSNPADPEVEIREAVAWALASGALVGVARMAAGRRAANYYIKSTGHLPPGLEKEEEKPKSKA